MRAIKRVDPFQLGVDKVLRAFSSDELHAQVDKDPEDCREIASQPTQVLLPVGPEYSLHRQLLSGKG